MTWHPIPGWPGYELNADGEIRSWRRGRPRVLVPRLGYTGYHVVQMYLDGARKRRPVAHLVAQVFYGERPAGAVIRHLNGDCLDNRAANLRYGTQSENIQDALRHGTHYWAAKTHCPAGHPYDEANTLRSGHSRHCRECNRVASLRYRARKKAAA